MEERERCFSFILSRTPHETEDEENNRKIVQKRKRKIWVHDFWPSESERIPTAPYVSDRMRSAFATGARGYATVVDLEI
jgi:hypothetical protein